MAMAMTLVGLVAVACGGGSKSTSSTTTPASVETTGSTAGSVGGVDTTQCIAAGQAIAAAEAAIPQAIAGNVPDLSSQLQAMQTFAASAPEEIRSDLGVVVDAFAQFAQIIQDANLQPGQTPSAATIAQLTQAASALNTTEITTALQNVNTWIAQNCSV
jgi:hypothetical protein